MTTPWQPSPPPATRTSRSSYNIQADASVLDELGVFLIYGTNVFGDRIFSYLETTVRRLQEMAGSMNRGENFRPSDYGTVVAAGRGEPSAELKEEMRIKYNLVDSPAPTMQRTGGGNAKPAFTPPPKFSFDEEPDDE